MLATDLAVIITGTLFLAMLAFIAAYRPVILFAFLFILVTLLWRTIATMYIDLAGPVYSSQTLRHIGPGAATPIHVLAYALTLLPFFVVIRRGTLSVWAERADRRRASASAVTLSDLTYGASCALVGWLFLDLARIGVLPFSAGMERYVYTAQFAGAAHRWLIEYGDFLCFWWGMMFAAEKIRNNRLDIRYLALLLVIFVYLVLTGNRFSAFYGFSAFFVMPFAAVVAVMQASRPAGAALSWLVRLLGRREIIVAGLILLAAGVAVGLGLYNNLTNVRGYSGPALWARLLERLLIQPSELGWISYERIFLLGQWNPAGAFDFLFFHPLDPSRNTTPQFLMLETIGEPRTSLHVLLGFHFAGGFPEIFFELFGPYLAWPFLLGVGWISAALTALFVRSIIQGLYASAFFALYVLFGFFIMYISGMLNFALVWTYWVKLAALAGAVLAERFLSRHGLALLPWVIVRALPRPEAPHGPRASPSIVADRNPRFTRSHPELQGTA